MLELLRLWGENDYISVCMQLYHVGWNYKLAVVFIWRLSMVGDVVWLSS